MLGLASQATCKLKNDRITFLFGEEKLDDLKKELVSIFGTKKIHSNLESFRNLMELEAGKPQTQMCDVNMQLHPSASTNFVKSLNTFLALIIEEFSAECVVKLIQYGIELVEDSEVTRGDFVELLCASMSKLSALKEIKLQYGDLFLARRGDAIVIGLVEHLCSLSWNKSCSTTLLAGLRDFLWLEGTRKVVIKKAFEILKDCELESIPEVIYQMLFLVDSSHEILFLTSLEHYFTSKMQHVLSDAQKATLYASCGTSLLHLLYFVKNGHFHIDSIVKYIKTAAEFDDYFVLFSFFMSKFSPKTPEIFSTIKNKAITLFKRHSHNSFAYLKIFSKETAQFNVQTIEKRFVFILDNFKCGWDVVCLEILKFFESVPADFIFAEALQNVFIEVFRLCSCYRFDLLESYFSVVSDAKFCGRKGIVFVVCSWIAEDCEFVCENFARISSILRYADFFDDTCIDSLAECIKRNAALHKLCSVHFKNCLNEAGLISSKVQYMKILHRTIGNVDFWELFSHLSVELRVSFLKSDSMQLSSLSVKIFSSVLMEGLVDFRRKHVFNISTQNSEVLPWLLSKYFKSVDPSSADCKKLFAVLKSFLLSNSIDFLIEQPNDAMDTSQQKKLPFVNLLLLYIIFSAAAQIHAQINGCDSHELQESAGKKMEEIFERAASNHPDGVTLADIMELNGEHLKSLRYQKFLKQATIKYIKSLNEDELLQELLFLQAHPSHFGNDSADVAACIIQQLIETCAKKNFKTSFPADIVAAAYEIFQTYWQKSNKVALLLPKALEVFMFEFFEGLQVSDSKGNTIAAFKLDQRKFSFENANKVSNDLAIFFGNIDGAEGQNIQKNFSWIETRHLRWLFTSLMDFYDEIVAEIQWYVKERRNLAPDIASVTGALTSIAQSLCMLLASQIPLELCSRAFASVVSFYRTLLLVFQMIAKEKIPFADAERFTKEVMYRLPKALYTFIPHFQQAEIEQSTSEMAFKKKKTGAKTASGARVGTSMLPQLIFHIEVCERAVMAAGKACGTDLKRFVARSIARDFKIKQDAILNAATAEDTIAEANEQPSTSLILSDDDASQASDAEL